MSRAALVLIFALVLDADSGAASFGDDYRAGLYHDRPGEATAASCRFDDFKLTTWAAGLSSSYTYDVNNPYLLNRYTKPDGSYVDYGYDANGDMTSMQRRASGGGLLEDWSYEYSRDRFVNKVSLGAEVKREYERQGDTYMIRRDFTAGAEKRYVRDGDSVLAELNDANQVTATYFGSGMDKMLSETRGGVTKWNLAGPGGSVMAVADVSGDIVSRYRYDAFGKRNAASSGIDPVANQRTFQGRPHDEGLGLTNFRNRWYDPETGRFAQWDKVEDPTNFGNPYVFPGCDPVNRMDPMGLGDEEDEEDEEDEYEGPKLVPDTPTTWETVKETWSNFKFWLGHPTKWGSTALDRQGRQSRLAALHTPGLREGVLEREANEDMTMTVMSLAIPGPQKLKLPWAGYKWIRAMYVGARFAATYETVRAARREERPQPKRALKNFAFGTLGARLFMVGPGPGGVPTSSPQVRFNEPAMNLSGARQVSVSRMRFPLTTKMDLTGAFKVSRSTAIPGDVLYVGKLPQGSWTLSPRGEGAHLIGKVHVSGREALKVFNLSSTPRYYPAGSPAGAGQAHLRLHRAVRATGIKFQKGNLNMSDSVLLRKHLRAYSDPRLAGIRGDLRTPGSEVVIGRGKSPKQAYELLLKWAEQLRIRVPASK